MEGRGWRSRLRSVATERIVDPAPAAPAVRESDAPIHILLVSIGLGPFAADYYLPPPPPLLIWAQCVSFDVIMFARAARIAYRQLIPPWRDSLCHTVHHYHTIITAQFYTDEKIASMIYIQTTCLFR